MKTLTGGGGAILLEEGMLTAEIVEALCRWLDEQPSWSDIPVIILTNAGEASDATVSHLNLLGLSGNVTFLERPFRSLTLVNTVQAALRARRRQYQVRDLLTERESVLNSITDVRFVLDNQMRFVAVNRAAEQILFGRTAEELVGKRFVQACPQDAHSELYAGSERAFLKQEPTHFEAFSPTANRWFEAHAYPLPDRLEIYLRDITARKQAETALQESERRFRALANAVPSITWTASPDGAITWASEQWHEFTGLRAEQSRGEWSKLVLHPEDYKRCVDSWNEALEARTDYAIEVRYRRYDGEYRWFLTRAVPVRDEEGRVRAWFGTTTDIDNQKRAEERFVRLNETLLSVLEAIPDVVFVTGMNAGIEFKNPAATRFMNAAGLRTLPPEILVELERVLQTGKDHIPTDFKTVHRFMINNQERFFLNRTVAMVSPENQPFGAVTMLQDVTEFRLLDEVKTNLIGTVSHELKTPITGVLTALIVLLEQSWGPLNPKQVELLSIARDDSERLLRTLHALLDLTRFEGNTSGIRCEQTTPAELVHAAVEEVRTVAMKADVVITTKLDPSLSPVHVDRERVRHALTNFLTNAIKFSPPGGEIVVGARRENHEICFTVSDQGPGIPQEYQGRIFDKLVRVPDAPKQGAGLGLSIAKEFVRAHGGRIGVRSKPGTGSEFYFYLPIT